MTEPHESQEPPIQCACVKDPFALLPPEMRLREQKKSGLRKVTAPAAAWSSGPTGQRTTVWSARRKAQMTMTMYRTDHRQCGGHNDRSL